MIEGREVHDQLYQLPPLNSQEDQRQENELAKLEGRNPHHFQRRYAANLSREYGYGLTPSESTHSMFLPQLPDPDVMERLIEWVNTQEHIVALAVLEYLDQPTDKNLDKVRKLVNVQIDKTLVAASARCITLTDLLVRALPSDIESLYALARREHQSIRPEAAVRQTLRNLTRRKAVEKIDNVWHRVS